MDEKKKIAEYSNPLMDSDDASISEKAVQDGHGNNKATVQFCKNNLQHLLSSISLEREKDKQKHLFEADNSEFVSTKSSQFWSQLFVQNILNVHSFMDASADDMLFYVRKIADMRKGRLISSIEVFRKNCPTQPQLEDNSIDWEETVYLNLIMQHFEYTVTCAVCSRTGAKELQILRKFSQKVYASPSRHTMDGKAAHEEMTYPNIFFTVDNFEECFSQCFVNDSELICVELCARNRMGQFQGVIFLGSIRYEALSQVYNNRVDIGSRLTMRSAFASWGQPETANKRRRMEFMRMRGPHGKGHAEMAVTRSLTEEEKRLASERCAVGQAKRFPALEKSHSCNSTQPSLANHRLNKSYSECNALDALGNVAHQKDESADVGSILSRNIPASSSSSSLETSSSRTFGQSWNWFRERRLSLSLPLDAYLTYISLPWNHIIADIFEARQQPILTFDIDIE